MLNQVLKLLKKYWYVPLIIAGVIFALIVFRDRVKGFFVTPETKIMNTAVSIQAISSVAYLTTAEYYGEVTYSWADVFRQTNKSQLRIDYEKVRKDIQEVGREIPLNEKDNSWNERWKKFKKSKWHKNKNKKIYKQLKKRTANKSDDKNFLWYVGNHKWDEFNTKFGGPLKVVAKEAKATLPEVEAAYKGIRNEYNSLLVQVPRQLRKDKWQGRSSVFKKKFLKGKLNREYDNGYTQLRKLTEYNGGLRPNQDFLAYVYDNTWNQFQQKYQVEINNEIRKAKPKKKELVYVGRGHSRAGFNLKNLPASLPKLDSAGHLRVDSIEAYTGTDFKDTLDLYNFDPFQKTVINPWYIVELGIPGFQVLQYDAGWIKNRQFSFEEITQVKKGCVDQLEQDAIKRDIFNEARHSAELILANLFQDIQIVEVHSQDSLVYHQINFVRIHFSDSFEVAQDIRTFKNEFLADGNINAAEGAELEPWLKSQSPSTFPQIRAFLKILEDETTGAKDPANYAEWRSDLAELRSYMDNPNPPPLIGPEPEPEGP